MDDRVIQADAGRTRKTIQSLEVGLAAMLDDKILDQLIQLPGRHTGLDMLSAIFQGGSAQGIGPPHPVQFLRILDLDHRYYASKAFITSAVVCSMELQ